MQFDSLSLRAWRVAELRREAERFVGSFHPNFNFFGATAFRIVLIGVRRVWADLDGDYDAAPAVRRFAGRFQVITYDRAVVAVRSPIADEFCVGIARMRMPDLVGLLQISGNDCVHEIFNHALFGFVAKDEPQSNGDENRQRRGADDVARKLRWRFLMVGVKQAHWILPLRKTRFAA